MIVDAWLVMSGAPSWAALSRGGRDVERGRERTRSARLEVKEIAIDSISFDFLWTRSRKN